MNGRRVESWWASLHAHAEWSNKQFGLPSARGGEGPRAHLRKELLEVEKALTNHDAINVGPGDAPDSVIEESADCVMLLFDAARRDGCSFRRLIHACWDKLEVNQRREWQEPNADGSVEHVRRQR